MFGKAMNRYYYGKSGQGDYNKDDLPTNRWQLFWEMLRVRFSGLMRLNLMYMIIWLPAIIASAIMPLVPGIAFTNGIRDIANGDYISGAVRMLDATLIFLSIAVGVGVMFMIYHALTGGVMP